LKYTNNFKDIKINKDEISVFAYEEFVKTQGKKYGWFYNDIFVLPVAFYESKRLFLRLKVAFFTAPLTGVKIVTEEEERFFLREVIALLKKMKTTYIRQPLASALFLSYPDKAVECFFGTYKIDLLKEEKEIFSEIHSKHRNVIRKAEKEGVVIHKGEEYIEEAYGLLEQTYQRQNRSAIKKEIFLKEVNNLKNNSEIYISYYNGVPQTSALLVHSKYSSYYLHGGMCSKPQLGANNLLHWTAIRDMKGKGVLFYDFMGARVTVDKDSKLYGVQNFKKRFCKEMTKGYLWKYIIDKKKYYLINLFLLLKNGKIPEDSIDQERKKGNYNS